MGFQTVNLPVITLAHSEEHLPPKINFLGSLIQEVFCHEQQKVYGGLILKKIESLRVKDLKHNTIQYNILFSCATLYNTHYNGCVSTQVLTNLFI